MKSLLTMESNIYDYNQHNDQYKRVGDKKT